MNRQKVVVPVTLKNEIIGHLSVISFYPTNCSSNYFMEDIKEFFNVIKSDEIDNESPILYGNLGNNHQLMLLEETKYQISFEPLVEYEKIRILTTIRDNYEDVFEPLNITSENPLKANINFKSFAGKSFFDVSIDNINSDLIPFEVRSKKINYMNEYVEMVAELSNVMSGILFKPKSPLFQNFEQNNIPKNTYYEYYMFLEYLFLDENLPYAYEYIRKNIFVNLRKYLETVPTAFANNIGSSILVNIVNNPKDLIKTNKPPQIWPENMRNYVPNNIEQPYFEESVDTPENRLVKYFLVSIEEIIEKLLVEFKENSYFNDRLQLFKTMVSDYLSDQWLMDVNKLEKVPMNSQVLQKKEGYRDIFKYYLNYEFGFKPEWNEIEDIFNGNERKLSELYEIWCYFKLLKIIEEITNYNIYYEDLFQIENKNINLKQGQNSKIELYFEYKGKNIILKFFYNLTFSKNNYQYYSYSLQLRPDYVIEINFNDKTHFILFDAKYKSKGIPNEDLFNKKDHIYKFEDVYKMHTYKDAIKNSLGAYVLYPGGEAVIFPENQNNLIPSVGAFNLKPGNNLKENKIEDFIRDILDWLIKES
ncbi:Domain of unknown function DUF2357-containing protein [Methanobacterium lacus]|uniref:DUF2357 domain-containing protein n=1 Tax=Methanobacterium lacus (strain AL-21) TaxID=877455 RepID=F0T8V9_METLA|nr:DUF2357 domain-containing protein [Methanobacterium lacus]ADZ09787.1 Domain of unknown function DUF2357-containing protein [Methanobacterium lacus]